VSSNGFPFHSRSSRPTNYSGSAAALEQEAVKGDVLLHDRMADSFHQWLIESVYRNARTAQGFTGHGSGPISPGGDMSHPRGILSLTVCANGQGHRGVPSASSRGGEWRAKQAEVPSPGVSLPGPFVTPPSSGPSGGDALAAYLRGKVAKFEQRFLNRYGPAQVGFGII